MIDRNHCPSSNGTSVRLHRNPQTAHAVLGVGRGASRLEVREAYIRLVKKFHPDMNSGDLAAERRFKRINQAYEELKSGDPSSHHELGAFPRHRQHRRGAIVIATAAALFAVSPGEGVAPNASHSSALEGFAPGRADRRGRSASVRGAPAGIWWRPLIGSPRPLIGPWQQFGGSRP
jgi:curved DNA-binding protein CbpA